MEHHTKTIRNFETIKFLKNWREIITLLSKKCNDFHYQLRQGYDFVFQFQMLDYTKSSTPYT